MKKIFLSVLIIIFYTIASHATVRTASVTGNWNSSTTWGGTVPAANDDIVINSGITVTININPVNINNVTINGTLQWDATGTARTWTVAGTFTINAAGTFRCATPGTATTHTLNYNGSSFNNNGTLDMVNSSNKCNVVIGGNTAQTMGGSSLYTFNKLTLNNTSGKFQIDYADTFTPSELNPTKFNVAFTTADSLVVKQGLLIVCAMDNASYVSTVANLRIGSSTSKISSSVNAFSGVATITMNTCLIVNDATNVNVSLNISGSFTSPDMTHANSAIAFALLGPNCQGGANSFTKCEVGGDMNIPDLFGFVGNAKLYGGVEPKKPVFKMNGNVYWQYSKSHSIDIPFTSQDITIKTFFFGLFDSQGTHPVMQLSGNSVTPYTFDIPFHVFDAPIQTSNPPGSTIIAQISESAADWAVYGNYLIVSGAGLAVHSDDTLTIADDASLHIQSGGEIAGSETETDPAGYIPLSGPQLNLAPNANIYTENIMGFGKGILPDSLADVSFKNRTADLDWNLSEASTAGKIVYAATASQTITDRKYNNLTTSGSGTKTMAGAITVNGITIIGGSTTLANGGYNATTKGQVTNNGKHTGTGKIIIGGTVLQGLNGSGNDWGNIEIKNAAGASTYQNVTTSGKVTFTNGILNTSTLAKLKLTLTGNISGGSALSCVYGPMDKTTNNSSLFLFPVGKGGNYRPLSFTSNAASSTTFTAEYFAAAFSNTTSFQPPITSVNTHSYWTLNHPGVNVSVTLVWGTSEALADLNGLTVAAFTGSAWTNAGVSAVTGTTSSGSVTSDPVVSYTTFTLGEANTITTNAVTGSPFCPEETINVPFTSTGTFNSGNVYTAQLSDKTGSFSSPSSIGTLNSIANSGIVAGTIPSKPGDATKYRVRIISSSPAVTGTDNGTNFEIIGCNKATGLASSNLTSSSATITWTTVSCAVKYKIQYRVQGSASWTNKYSASGTYSITGLAANTIYEWRIQTYCSASGSSKSGTTAIQTFTTTLRLPSAISGNINMNMYPNPASATVQLIFNSSSCAEGSLKVFNAVGKKMLEDKISLSEGNHQFSLDITSLSPGIYFVEFINGNDGFIQKLVKE